jgi:hypothetical protein
LATKQRTFSFTFHWPPSKEPSPSPSIGHQTTFSFTFLPFLFKRRTQIIGALFFPGHNFQFNWENTCFRKLLEEEKND